ncbi:MAG: AMP-binding protein [Nitrospirae bacterium]|nr:AMP-binding protein [Nitrospirota bacterium]
MLINNFIEESAKKSPDKTALITKEGRCTYAEIEALSNRVANALLSEGFNKGERVAIFLDNSLEAAVGLFGVLKAGGVFTMVNPTAKAEKLSYILNNCRCAALIASGQKISITKKACADAAHLKWIYLQGDKILVSNEDSKKMFPLNEIMRSGDNTIPIVATADTDLANIVYTSGSTGNPKGVMMTHLNMVSAVNSITQYLENTSEDVILNTLPMSFDYGLYQVLMAFKTGATVILEKTFTYPYEIIQTLIAEKVTGLPIVPTIAAILLQMKDIKKFKFEHLRYISNTAAALPEAHIKKLQEIFTNTKIFLMYGLTECKRVSYLPPEQINVRPASVGKAMPDTEAYIVDEDGNKLGAGVAGELVVKGRNVMKGYWGLPDETAERLRPEPSSGETVLYTGDLFRMDEDGYLYFIGRKDDIIKSRGEKVSPKEIENVLYEIRGIVEAAVVGVPDPVLGEAIKAIVVTNNGHNLTERYIRKFCSEHLEDFMVPKYVEFRSELPKTDSGKIKKTDLKQCVA